MKLPTAADVELKEALEQQAATAEILKVIASSPSDVQPVFDAIAQSAKRLLGGFSSTVFRFIDGMAHLKAFTPTTPEADEVLTSTFPVPVTAFAPVRMIRSGEVVQIPDTEDPSYELKEVARARGYRSMIWAPLLNQGEAIGFIAVTRTQTGAFADHHIQLLQTFADQAVIAIENTRRFNETQEALERQTATADILKVIASSPDDVQPVFDAIAQRSNRIVDGFSTTVLSIVDGIVYLSAFTRTNPEADAALLSFFPRPLSAVGWSDAVMRGKIFQYADTEVEIPGQSPRREMARLRGWRSAMWVPLLRDGKTIGAIGVTRTQPGHFHEHHVKLLQTFADQAVIAIHNVRLFKETKEALERQTATAEILKVIASSPSDIQPVFEAIVQTGLKLFPSSAVMLVLAGDGIVKPAAIAENDARLAAMLKSAFPVPLTREFMHTVAILDGRLVDIPDAEDGPVEFPAGRRAFLSTGHRAITIMPLMRGDQSIGALSVVRRMPGPLSASQLELLKTFADQAVIAIENARLLKELHQRTDDLADALTYQTGSSNVLRVIASSPTNVEPVLGAIVESACQLCEADDAAVLLKDGHKLRFSAHHGPISIDVGEWPINRGWVTGRAFLDQTPVHVRDLLSEEGAEFPDGRELTEHTGSRVIHSILAVPLLRKKESIGAILLRRTEVRPFDEKQISLLQSFADQAVIAIGNVQLFEEVQARTHELTESLEQQTATAEVLGVISRSTGDLAPVFDTMLNKAMQLCQANFGVLSTFDGSHFHTVATYGLPVAYDKFRRSRPVQPGPGTSLTRLLHGEPHVELRHLAQSETYLRGDPDRRALVDLGGAHSLLSVPLLKEERVVGSVLVFRQEDSAFSEKQIALLKQFAAQAVIAIENARLLNELRQRTDDLSESLQQQTATSDVLQIISSSPGVLAPVFDKMLENAIRVCGAEFGSMNLVENGAIRAAAQYNVPAEYAAVRSNQVFTPHPTSPLATAMRTGRVVHWADLRTTASYRERYPSAVDLVELGGAGTVAIVPMLRDEEAIGAITIFRKVVQPFSDKQIELLSNFAKQAVIAIENARLLKELRQRTEDLTKSLNDLRTAQDRLVQTEKLASLGQLTAGIAHEIKNPLNFINNFAALSAELAEELKELLERASLTAKMQEEVGELTKLLKDNLEKVVQHGKRADSIVKNMLLHSREGSREQRLTDVNALVDESLNLAYHGARAEKAGFEITVERDFDANAGIVEVFPQDVSRALLNLISNAFYAAIKRKTENDWGFEPIVSAITRDLGYSVEIRIRDNGTGIPPEVREKMFNPFFTTKPTGEGTGLGLSMTHDIIVKQHGGTIDVETRLGEFTEFIITLPRDNHS